MGESAATNAFNGTTAFDQPQLKIAHEMAAELARTRSETCVLELTAAPGVRMALADVGPRG